MTKYQQKFHTYNTKQSINGKTFRQNIHPELTRERSIRFVLFEIKRVLVYNSTLFKLTDFFILCFFI